MFNPHEGRKFAEKALHPGLAPEVAYHWGNYAPFILKHYGLKDKSDRDRKVERYNKYDPNADFKAKSYYDFLASNAPVTEFDEDKLHDMVANEVKDYKHKIPTLNMSEKKYYYVKNPGGVIVDIPAEALDETLKRDGFELISKDPVVVGGTVASTVQTTTTEVEEPQKEENEMTCTECGFVAKSEFGLRAHSRKHARADNSKV